MSQLSDLVIRVEQQSKRYGFSQDPGVVFLFLMEELGETVRAYLKDQGHKEENNRVTESFYEELGDVFHQILRIAALTHTDLEKALDDTIKKVDKRYTSRKRSLP